MLLHAHTHNPALIIALHHPFNHTLYIPQNSFFIPIEFECPHSYVQPLNPIIFRIADQDIILFLKIFARCDPTTHKETMHAIVLTWLAQSLGHWDMMLIANPLKVTAVSFIYWRRNQVIAKPACKLIPDLSVFNIWMALHWRVEVRS